MRRARWAFDGLQRVVLYDGRDRLNLLQDTWLWNGSAWTVITTGSSPPASMRSAMAYDYSRARPALFGGFDPGTGASNTTWEWVGNAWAQVPGPAMPQARFDHAVAYDASAARVCVFGGSGSVARLGDFWSLDGTTWQQPPGANQPSAHARHVMAYDPER